MLNRRSISLAAVSALMLTVSACGGAGGGVASAPPPPPTPTPTPPPPPPPTIPPIPDQPIGLAVNGSFAVFSSHYEDGKTTAAKSGLQFAYSAASNEYTISVPGFQAGQLVPTGASGSIGDDGKWIDISSTVNDVTNSDGKLGVTLAWPAHLGFKYTSMGSWASTDGQWGNFVYGVPTLAGDMPITGSADYSGVIRGLTSDQYDVFGGISLSFNFGAGTLSGAMTPDIAPVWDTISLGTYTFRDTVYSTGSTAFSGAFDVAGSNAPSSFQGEFTGPSGVELMGSWEAPYLNPISGDWGSMSGVFIGGKEP